MPRERDFAIVVDRSCQKTIDGKEELVIHGGELSLKPWPEDWREIYLDYTGQAFFVSAAQHQTLDNLSFYCPMVHPYPGYDFLVRSGWFPHGKGLLTNRSDARFVYEGDVELELIPNATLPRLYDMPRIAVEAPGSWFGILTKRRDWLLRTHWSLHAYSFGFGEIEIPAKIVSLLRWDEESIDENWAVGTITELKN